MYNMLPTFKKNPKCWVGKCKVLVDLTIVSWNCGHCCRYKWAEFAEDMSNRLSRSERPSYLQAVYMPWWGCSASLLLLSTLM